MSKLKGDGKITPMAY